MSRHDPDLPLVEALQAGDESALDRLMERHGEPLFRFLCRYVPNETEARELAQETFVRAYFNIGKFRPEALFATWLFQIALNLCRDRARSRAFRQARQTESLSPDPLRDEGGADREIPSATLDPALRAAWNEEMEILRREIARLPDELRAPLVLTALENLSHAEAGLRLGLSAKAVEVRVYRARKRLVKRLGPF